MEGNEREMKGRRRCPSEKSRVRGYREGRAGPSARGEGP